MTMINEEIIESSSDSNFSDVSSEEGEDEPTGAKIVPKKLDDNFKFFGISETNAPHPEKRPTI
jgi:hypothetical protein